MCALERPIKRGVLVEDKGNTYGVTDIPQEADAVCSDVIPESLALGIGVPSAKNASLSDAIGPGTHGE